MDKVDRRTSAGDTRRSIAWAGSTIAAAGTAMVEMAVVVAVAELDVVAGVGMEKKREKVEQATCRRESSWCGSYLPVSCPFTLHDSLFAYSSSPRIYPSRKRAISFYHHDKPSFTSDCCSPSRQPPL